MCLCIYSMCVCEGKRESMGIVTANGDFNGWQRGGEQTFIVTDGLLLKVHYYHGGKRQTGRWGGRVGGNEGHERRKREIKRRTEK